VAVAWVVIRINLPCHCRSARKQRPRNRSVPYPLPDMRMTTIMRSYEHAARATLMACLLALGSSAAAEPPREDVPKGEGLTAPTVMPDPLAGTLAIDPAATGPYAKEEIASMLPPRTDSPWDWQAGLVPLHACGDPRWLPPCVPPPPCHPACPPQPYDLVGVDGLPTRGPRYRGPCCPRTGTHDDGPLPRVYRIHDRAFDWFYRTK